MQNSPDYRKSSTVYIVMKMSLYAAEQDASRCRDGRQQNAYPFPIVQTFVVMYFAK